MRLRALSSAVLALGLACANPVPEEEAPTPAPTPTAAPVAPPAGTFVPDEAPPEGPWPLFAMATIPGGRTATVTGDVVDLDVAPSGRFAVAVTGDGKAWAWDFAGAPVPIAIEGAREVAFSPFDGALYVVRQAGAWTIEVGRVGTGGTYAASGTVYSSPEPLSSLVTAFARYNDHERVFFARGEGKTRILSVRRSGEAAYEVTSPNGALGDLTAPEVRTPPDEWTLTPNVFPASDARPLSVHPATGTLLWLKGGKDVIQLGWDEGTGNWATAQGRGKVHETWSPNGYYTIGWQPGVAGVVFRDPEGRTETVSGPTFRSPPVSSANGRTLVGWTDAGLETLAVPLPLAPVRYLTAAEVPASTLGALAREGMAVYDTEREQLHEVLDDVLYDGREPPVYASVDGLLEVLHAGFQAVFVRVEREVSRPRLGAFLAELEAASTRVGNDRVKAIAVASKRILDGDYAFPDGERVLAEGNGTSELHGAEVDFQDFHPRGPYATSEALQHYFRAFKYIDLLQLDDEERRALRGEAALVGAWKAWIDTQAPYLSGTRYDGMLGDGWAKSPYVLAECVPERVREHPFRVFPLSWGRDSEILERTVAHDALPPACTVPQRVFPSGLDLLTAFGSPEAAAIQRAEYKRHPTLEATHAALRKRFGGEVPSDRFVDAWMRLVQILGTDTRVPEGVEPERWRRRLIETALASWASFRHTTVLVNEGTAAQMGEGGDAVFETITTEPVRGVVDPVPAAWAQTARLLGTLSEAAKATPTTDRLAEVLGQASADATRLGALSERQMRGEPLAVEDYAFIARFAGVVEHPFLLLSAAAAGKEDELSAPEPMMKIVDIHAWNDPQGPVQHWHAAVGRPRAVTVLLGDRGVLVPGSGVLYAYHEVVADRRLDDDAWREEVDQAARPAWANPSLPSP